MRHVHNSFIIFFLLIISYSSILGQDIHYAQYFNSPLNVNPALTGIFQGDLRVSANYRNQWATAQTHYNTGTIAADMKLPQVRLGNGYFAGGLLFNYDHAGDSKLSLTQFGLSASYTQQLAEKHFISFGVLPAINNRRFDLGNLQFEDSRDGTTVVPTDEVFDNTAFTFFDLSAGFNYHYQYPSKRTKADIGISLYHINTPQYGFDDNLQDLFAKLAFNALFEFQVMSKLDLILNGLYQDQGPHTEILVGLGARHYLSTETARELAVEIGFNYRLGDAIYPHLEFIFRNLTLGLSYDINISDFQESSNGRGGPEIYFQYLFTKVRPSEIKICPIY